MNAVTLGAISSHGGKMITATSNLVADGVPLCCSGDLHACPIEGHNITPVISYSTVVGDGTGLIIAGRDYAGCGALILSGASSVWAI